VCDTLVTVLPPLLYTLMLLFLKNYPVFVSMKYIARAILRRNILLLIF